MTALLARLRTGIGWPSWLPRGGSLPEHSWRIRHRCVTGLLALHLVGVPFYGAYRGEPTLDTVLLLGPALLLMLVACAPRLGRSVTAASAALGLIYCSGVVVHLSHGLVEAHFHFFVVIPVIAMYEAWLPFALGVVYVLLHHGWMGTVDPRMVYNHPGAWERPWLFAAVHAVFFACACLACVVNWWLHERARHASHTQTQLLRTIVDSLQDGLVVTDASGRVVLHNPASDALMPGVAWTPPVAGDDGPEGTVLAHADGTPVAHDEMPHLRALAGETVHELDLHLPGPEGGPVRVLSFSAVALDARDANEERPVVVIARDVTERHRTQEALSVALATEQHAVERLSELERVKTNLIATVSHELRTPLTSIVGYLELLEDGALGTLQPGQLELVGRVERNTQRLLRLVDDLLTHAQIESTRLVITTARTDLRAVVVAAREAVAPLLAKRQLEIVTDVPPDPVVLDVDAVEMERMISNLLTNAIKFTLDGGQISVGLAEEAHGVLLTVTDTGLGIPADEQDRLFTRFFRSTTATERAIQGTGLGLAIVQAIVQLHGGHISVVSRPGEGTTFTVTLPRREAAGTDSVLDGPAGTAAEVGVAPAV